ncbi:hypothetical protein ACFU76_39315, partial [Streptomyces sp. NPDC057539]
ARPAGPWGRTSGPSQRQDQPTAGTNTVQNGGFEQATTLTSTSTPWYSEGSLAYGVDNGTGTAHTGTRNAWISSTQAGVWGAIKQTVTVTPNKRYRLTAWVENSGSIEQGWLGAKTTGHHGTAPTCGRVVLTLDSGTSTSATPSLG